MHLTRTKAIRLLPIPRKKTKYVARAASHVSNGIPLVIAIRDMLGLAKTSKEVEYMIRNKLIKINGKEAKDVREAIKLFNVLEADKSYKLIILPTGRFKLEETKENSRLCKIIGKTLVKGNKAQLNLHDGTNILLNEKEKANVGDSVELDLNNKVKRIIKIEKGKNVFVISGKSIGLTGKIENVEGKKTKLKLNGTDKEVELNISHIIVR